MTLWANRETIQGSIGRSEHVPGSVEVQQATDIRDRIDAFLDDLTQLPPDRTARLLTIMIWLCLALLAALALIQMLS